MGNAKFWFYPQPIGSRLVEIDLGEPLGELFFDFEIQQETSTSMSGAMYRSVNLTRQVITIQRDRLKLGEDTANKLRAMENHLNRGYPVALCSDADRAYCYPIQNFPYTGDNSCQLLGDPFFQMTGGGNLPSANDYIAIDTPSPGSTYEVLKYSSATGPFTAANGGTVNFSSTPFNFSYSRPAFARYYRYWPCLKMPSSQVGKSIITNENGILFSLELTLVPDLQLLFSFHPLYNGQDQTIDFDFIQPGEIVPPEQMMNNDRGGFSRMNTAYNDKLEPGNFPWNMNQYWDLLS